MFIKILSVVITTSCCVVTTFSKLCFVLRFMTKRTNENVNRLFKEYFLKDTNQRRMERNTLTIYFLYNLPRGYISYKIKKSL